MASPPGVRSGLDAGVTVATCAAASGVSHRCATYGLIDQVADGTIVCGRTACRPGSSGS